MNNTNFQPLPYPQTPETARAYFLQHGINRSEWARFFGIDQQAISDHLRGKLKGTWGESHKVAVLLGLKPNPETKAAA
ncbi:DNA-binding protein [Glaesserella parasuis]|uniref:Phage-associated protein, BcepMu gp16 family n=1 Tax=[Actinobacillus] rossii TaxID=123820 RepID=A0A380U0T9_9PAST|nr:DNA-binding protein [Glaesserella parasuis]MDY3123667.1 DNA-binding protein [[Actinobacillus] rossii]MCT8552475.1 DNA-binding protein [Glaesserella parasuis]MCT8755910.1 DNA-binding protein [Glaesserella parasuis]MDG4924223.1 DNA-binding protein [Glaesserella parasuis]MDG6226693.1 DNA-binding protein [Glaesserella parasuis]